VQRQWFEEVSVALANTECLSTKKLQQLIDNGGSISPHPVCESALLHLQDLLTKCLLLDDRAKQCLSSRANSVTVKSVIDDASQVAVYLPNVAALHTANSAAAEWTMAVDKSLVQRLVYVDVLESKVVEAQSIPLHLDRLSQLESLIAEARSWSERTAKTFLKKHSTLSLIEVLTPRTDIGANSVARIRRRKQLKDLDDIEYNADTSAVLHLLSDISEDFMPDSAKLVSAYHSDTLNEIESMMTLRAFNVTRTSDITTEKFCLCRQLCSNNMLQCELCKDLYHAECLSVAKSAYKSSVLTLFSDRFLCPVCVRSRRPRLEAVLSLLVALQKLPVRVAAGEVLQLVAERAISWQESARRLLALDDIAVALSHAGTDTDRKPAMTELQHRLPAPQHWAESRKYGPVETESTAPFEHAYSSVSKHNASVPHQSCGMQRKSTVSSMLAPELYGRLEQLMVEGDLLELTLDEIQQLWKLWKACHQKSVDGPSLSHVPGLKDDYFRVKMEAVTDDQRRKKRKHLEVRSEDSGMELIVTQKKFKSGEMQRDRMIQDGKRNKMLIKKGQRKQQQHSFDEDVAQTDSIEDDCSAARCLKPSGHEVDWVQCDKCQLWFHLICVGLTTHDVASDIEYLCQLCCGVDKPVVNYYTSDIPASAGNTSHHVLPSAVCSNAQVEVNFTCLPSDKVYHMSATVDAGCSQSPTLPVHSEQMVYVEGDNLLDNEIVCCTDDQVVYYGESIEAAQQMMNTARDII
jgi:histone demethylase JARID1